MGSLFIGGIVPSPRYCVPPRKWCAKCGEALGRTWTVDQQQTDAYCNVCQSLLRDVRLQVFLFAEPLTQDQLRKLGLPTDMIVDDGTEDGQSLKSYDVRQFAEKIPCASRIEQWPEVDTTPRRAPSFTDFLFESLN